MENKLEELAKVLSKMDLAPLKKKLTEVMTNPDFTLHTLIEPSRIGYYINITSNDLTRLTGIMKNVYSSFSLITFVGGTILRDKAGNNPQIYFSIHAIYSFKTGGQNGTCVQEAWYNVDKSIWSFN